jgi:Ca-activated chloride channel family protein
VKTFLSQLECGVLEDGTAIGLGLATAVNRLKESEATSKVVILLTDGVNNTGYQSPKLAAQIAQKFNIKVYTIGVGTMGETLAPVSRRSDGKFHFDIAKVEIDEDLLREIADMTGGQYFRATDEASLENIYDSIDQLEKTEIEVTSFRRYSEMFHRFALLGLIFLLLELVLRYSVLRAIP